MENWDLYTRDRQPTGKTMVRGEERPEGYYNIAVAVWIRNKDGKYLISQRAASKNSYPLFWETVGGGVVAGETSEQGAIREVREEVGVIVDPRKLTLLFSKFAQDGSGKPVNEIGDIYLYEMDGEYDEKNAVSDEVAQSKWLTRGEIRQYLIEGKLVPSLAYFFEKIDNGQ